MKHETLAAVDLGSNSFHLQIGRVVDEQIYLLDSLREPVRLAAGLTRERRLDRATQLRALDALGRFGERLRRFPKGAVRAVGTNALRVARNADAFLEEAESVLGFPVEVVFGREEARLIYLGVAHTLPLQAERRLVVDVGGGSTEFIIGTGLDPQLTESVPIGCVSYSMKFFADGRLEKACFKRAELAAGNEIERLQKAYRRAGWSHAVASSGTARAVAAILAACGWADHGITAEGLDRLRSHMVKAREVERLRLPALREDRSAILPGGVAILSAVFESLGIDAVDVSDAALRQGVLYDLLGRVRHSDARQATVSHFQRRYHADIAQAERVWNLARQIYLDLRSQPAEADMAMLGWAAALHEIGISIAHAGYHKHSAYILAQADMPGFSQKEQARLALIVLGHRGRLSKAELESLPANSADRALVFALRLASLFYRSRADAPLPPLTCRATDFGFEVAIAQAWLEEHPLTHSALEQEAEEWDALGGLLEMRAVADERRRAAG
ncbi:MAG: exopolyphosphatase [Betaproteobacteria bacterium RIFCSPLOWO2_12_FULL_62_13b]|nr:MAG: exopolyphosphatase [Betaproteobacteria bacterium RIFCSPLOWO2_12_FULL_62_13b]